MNVVMKRYIFHALLLLLLLFSSCTENGAGIFYSIEIEEPISNDSLSDYLSATEVAIVGTDYYLPANRLYHWDSGTAGTDFSRMTLPGNWYGTIDTAENNDNALLYAVLENSDGDDSGLFIYDGTSWTGAVTVPDGRPVAVWYADSDIFVLTVDSSESNKYRLYNSSDNNTTTPASITFSQVQVSATDYETYNPVRDLDVYSGTVFFITASNMYSGNDATFFAAVTTNITAGLTYRNLYYSSTFTTLYLTAIDSAVNGTGSIWGWDGGWTGLDTSIGSDLNDMCEIITNGSSTYLLVGNQSGYLESSNGSSFTGETSSTIDSNYDNTDLEGAVVNGFFDGPGDTFYAMTSGTGLWVNNGTGSWDLK